MAFNALLGCCTKPDWKLEYAADEDESAIYTYQSTTAGKVGTSLDVISGLALLVIGVLMAAGIIPGNSITATTLVGLGCLQLGPSGKSLLELIVLQVKKCCKEGCEKETKETEPLTENVNRGSTV